MWSKVRYRMGQRSLVILYPISSDCAAHSADVLRTGSDVIRLECQYNKLDCQRARQELAGI